MRLRTIAALASVALAGCGTTAPVTPEASATLAAVTPQASDGEPPLVLPGPNQQLPGQVAGATQWVRPPGRPRGFDPVGHATVETLADAFGAVISRSFGAALGERPALSLDVLEESDTRAVILISAMSAGDDFSGGTQYALVAVADGDGWRVDEVWARVLCTRGVAEQVCI